MKKELVDKILAETEAGYDLIADKFSETRKHFWRGLEFIGDYAQDGDKVLDFGCGNGRLLELIGDKPPHQRPCNCNVDINYSSDSKEHCWCEGKQMEYTGVDVSQKLIDIASRKYSQANVKFQKISSQSSLPFPDNYFNTIYSIAVFHHIPSRDLRLEIGKEIYRILKPGGKIVITVWNIWQKKYLKNLVSNYLRKLVRKSELDWNDCYISFKNNEGRIFQRYHHAFTKRGLKRLFREAGFRDKELFCQIVGKNVVLVVEK